MKWRSEKMYEKLPHLQEMDWIYMKNYTKKLHERVARMSCTKKVAQTSCTTKLQERVAWKNYMNEIHERVAQMSCMKKLHKKVAWMSFTKKLHETKFEKKSFERKIWYDKNVFNESGNCDRCEFSKWEPHGIHEHLMIYVSF